MLMRGAGFYKLFSAAAMLLLLCGSAAFALEDDFAKIRRESSGIRTLQADFVQKKFMKILSKPLVSEGRFYYEAPDSLRWEYVKPLKSLVIIRKNQIKRYLYSEGKMIEDRTGGAQTMKIVLQEVVGWMNGRFDQNPSFKATLIRKATPVITLVPADKNLSGFVEKIEITLAGSRGVVKSVKIFEGTDNFTQINFVRVQTNAPIDSAVFQDVP
ncbi:MAG TPA: outer membrane lipoprotein carrier protein LolA [Smithella sp.]|nr:outer membrane lipoprotein carrier protein LolA [Smithella sp.]